MMLMHPGVCLGYRFDEGDWKVAYITDNEITSRLSKYTEEYVQRHEVPRRRRCPDDRPTYFDEEYPSKADNTRTQPGRKAPTRQV